MSNPLVAPVQDSTKAYSGISMVESAESLKQGIESGDWASIAMGAVGTALDALTIAMDPFGAILAAGVGWLLEHVGPLKEALNALTGDADQIAANSETWKNIAAELSSVGNDLTSMVQADTTSWVGDAGDAYRQRSADTASLLQAASKGCEGASSGVKTAGEVVAAVRMLVRDTIAQLVGHLISWALQVVFTLGIGLAWVVPEVIAAVAKTASEIANVTGRLVKAIKALLPLLKKAGTLFEDAGKALRKIKPGEGVPKSTHGPVGSGPRAMDPPPKGGGSTTPSGIKDGPPVKTDDMPPPPKTDATTPSGAGDTPPPVKVEDTPPPPKADDAPPPKGSETPSDSTGNPNKPDNPRDRSVGPDDRVCKSDPVDIATGEVILADVDLDLPGDLALLLERTHVSSYRAGQWFGPSWTSTLDQRLEVDEDHVCYFAPDGTILVYPHPEPGKSVQPLEGPRHPLIRDADGSYVVEDARRGHLLRFDGRQGRTVPLRSVEGAAGQRIDVEYDVSGAPSAWRHTSGVTVGVRAARGRITELRVLGDRPEVDVVVMTYAYGESGHLAAVTNSSGRPRLFDYDPEGRLTGWQDRNGVWYRYVYDVEGRCVRTVGVGGFLDGTFSYDRERLLTTHTDSLGHSTVFELNERNQTVRETDPLGNSTSFVWDRHDRLLVRTDALGQTTRYEYDTGTEPSRIVRPDGSVVELAVTDGAVTAIVVRDGVRTWRRFYGATASSAAPDPLRDNVGVATELRVDRDADTQSTTDGIERDQFGRPVWEADGAGGRVRLGWSVTGLRAARVGPGAERALWRYDGEDNEIEQVDETGRVSRQEYGPFDLVTAFVDPAGARTAYQYDTELRLIAVTEPSSLMWTYGYDAVGRLVEQTDFDGRRRQYAYDAVGRLAQSIDPAGGSTGYRYDVLGNLVEVVAPGGITQYAYDPVGELTRASSNESTVEFERDEHGRVVRETIDDRAVEFAYDTDRRSIRRRTHSGAESEWFFDEADRPVALTSGGHLVRYRYDADGRAVERTVDGTGVLRQSFGRYGRLQTQTLPSQQRTFGYFPDGSPEGVHDTVAGPTRFTRDVAGNITTVSTPGLREDFGYDLSGKLVASALVGAWQPEADLGGRAYAANTITAAGAVTYRHDERGRRVLRTDRHPEGERHWQYSWDDADRLTGVVTPEGGQWHYRYDPLGRRTAKLRLGAAGEVVERTDFTWDGNALVEQAHTDPRGVRHVTTWDRHPQEKAPVAQLVRGPGGVAFHSVVTDAIGTPTELVDVGGATVWQRRSTLWGRTLPVAGQPLGFPGQYADAETGLQYNVHRYYDPATARYLSQDPLGLAAGPNPVAYPRDPVADCDPLGLMGCKQKAGGPSATPDTPGAGHNAGNSGGSAGTPNTVPSAHFTPKPDDMPNSLYRFTQQPPDSVFKDGFTAQGYGKGPHFNLGNHLVGAEHLKGSGYISTTGDAKAAEHFATLGGKDAGSLPAGAKASKFWEKDPQWYKPWDKDRPKIDPMTGLEYKKGPGYAGYGGEMNKYTHKEGYIYKFDTPPNAVHVPDQSLVGDANKGYGWQDEYAVINKVDPKNVSGVWKVDGYYQMNFSHGLDPKPIGTGPAGETIYTPITPTHLPGTNPYGDFIPNPDYKPGHPHYDPVADPGSTWTGNADPSALGLKQPGQH